MKLHRFFSVLSLVTALMLGSHLLSASPATAAFDATWERVQEAYQQARDRARADDVDHALALADAYLTKYPGDGRALTYRGSLAALRARISWLPWKKLALLYEGIDQMDAGVSLVSKTNTGSAEEIEVRLVRGITSASIPRTFGRGGVAFSDFKAVAKHPHFPAWPAAQRATALTWLAVMYQRHGQTSEGERLMREAEAMDADASRKVKELAV